MNEDQKSKMSPYENPGYVMQSDYELNMAVPGSKIYTMIVRKFRQGLIAKLSTGISLDLAANIADEVSWQIIKAHLVIKDPIYYRSFITDVDKIKEKYADELLWLERISELIQQGKTFSQIQSHDSFL